MDALPFWEIYCIYHSRALSSNANDIYTLFTISLTTFCAVHTESVMNQNRSISSTPTLLKVGSFRCATISLSREGGGIGEFLPLHDRGGDVAGGSCVAGSYNRL